MLLKKALPRDRQLVSRMLKDKKKMRFKTNILKPNAQKNAIQM